MTVVWRERNHVLMLSLMSHSDLCTVGVSCFKTSKKTDTHTHRTYTIYQTTRVLQAKLSFPGVSSVHLNKQKALASDKTGRLLSSTLEGFDLSFLMEDGLSQTVYQFSSN